MLSSSFLRNSTASIAFMCACIIEFGWLGSSYTSAGAFSSALGASLPLAAAPDFFLAAGAPGLGVLRDVSAS